MVKIFGDDYHKRYELLSKSIDITEKKIRSFPDGRIKIKKRKSGVYYYLSTGENNDRLLSESDRELIGALIQKSYLKKTLISMKKELKSIIMLQKVCPETKAEEIYDQLSAERRTFVKPIILGEEAYIQKWLETPYDHKPFKKNAPGFLTLKGERVRSKSEIIIADRLYANGIPYKYECPILVGGEIFHPDFTILRMSDRKILYHEHCGRMDEPGYTEDMVDRVNKYNEEGIIQGDRLFLSFETSDKPLDARVIDNLINKHFR